jgi:L-asparaginase
VVGQEITIGKDNIIIMTTGGTIAKTYDEFEGSLANRQNEIKDKINQRLRLPYTMLEVFSVLEKDSLHMTDYDRSLICKTIDHQLEKKSPIVILHGTDTMTKTAETYFNLNPNPAVPIIFTGAMRPLGMEESDAMQNITEALLAAKLLDPGIYISFHNKIFKVPHVRKNREKRTFECTEQAK